VVGNGPSLRKTDLDLISGEVSFAVNRIRLIYPETNWRPTHYVRAESMEYLGSPDPTLWLDDMLYHQDIGAEIWANLYFIKWMDRFGYDSSGINVPKLCNHYLEHYDSENCPHMWHLPIVCTYGSVVTVAIQLAVLQGYSPIYLLGCDLGYQDRGKNSHFSSDYVQTPEFLRPKNYANLDTLQGHIIAKRSSKVPIYNATVGGELEVYPRVKLDNAVEWEE
jgi:hypothetical protein